MKSMTGFGMASMTSSHLDLEISVKAINGRFLDVRFHMPREYYPFESEMKKKVTQLIRRGSIDVFVRRRLLDAGVGVEIAVQKKLARKWMRAYQELGQAVGLNEPVRIDTLATIPYVLEISGSQQIGAKEKAQVFSLLQTALINLNQEREREGKAIKKDLERHLQFLGRLIPQMEDVRGVANGEILKKMEARLNQAKLTGQVDEVRLAQEVALMVDRADIGEEIMRLREHLRTFIHDVKEGLSEGKKLDFYSQELLRETNTIGSKSQVVRMTQLVVEAKNRIEKVREQIQNIE